MGNQIPPTTPTTNNNQEIWEELQKQYDEAANADIAIYCSLDDRPFSQGMEETLPKKPKASPDFFDYVEGINTFDPFSDWSE